jgi:hypothetical protein
MGTDELSCSSLLFSASFMLVSCMAYSSALKIEVPPKHWLTFAELHGVTY